MIPLKRPFPSDDPNFAFQNRVVDHVTGNQPIRSGDFRTNGSIGGSHLRLHQKHKYTNNGILYWSEFDITSSYVIGDMVRVLPGKVYDYPWVSKPVPIGDHHLMQGQITINGRPYNFATENFAAIPGTYVCVANVPSVDFMVSFASLAGLNWYYGQVVPRSTISLDGWGASATVKNNLPYLRFTDVNYLPAWPEMPNRAVYDTSDLSRLNGHYWELISLLPKKTFVCTNGAQTEEFTDTITVPSGSSNYTGSSG